MKAYSEESFLPLSGLQHFAFCRRQWALIHIEEQWRENLRTMEGNLLHEKAHGGQGEKRGSLIISRSLPVFSTTLGLRGVCDVVEWRTADDGVPVNGRDGLWLPAPVEYKRGRPKEQTDADLLQLCAQALCLEEMLVCAIESGYLFYGETRRRLEVSFDTALRNRVKDVAEEMHELFRRRYTPRVKTSKNCRACSLADLCLPKLSRAGTVENYIQNMVGGEDA